MRLLRFYHTKKQVQHFLQQFKLKCGPTLELNTKNGLSKLVSTSLKKVFFSPVFFVLWRVCYFLNPFFQQHWLSKTRLFVPRAFFVKPTINFNPWQSSGFNSLCLVSSQAKLLQWWKLFHRHYLSETDIQVMKNSHPM